ncbi:MAG: hypothetical protein OXG09_11485 [Chloroflexi bacterium]|nr:hypothetical protein [Chloroflexota bacterium]
MSERNLNEERPEGEISRYYWLVSELEKQMDRFDAVRRVAYQKAAWMLLAATGFITLSGVTSKESIHLTFEKLYTVIIHCSKTHIEPHEYIIFGATSILVILYFFLFFLVWRIFYIKRLLIPFTLLGEQAIIPTEDLKDDNKREKWVEIRCNNAINNYIKENEFAVLKNTLDNFLDITTEQMKQNRENETYLKCAFRCLILFPLCFLLLLIFG